MLWWYVIKPLTWLHAVKTHFLAEGNETSVATLTEYNQIQFTL